MRTAKTTLVAALLLVAMASGAVAQSAPALVISDLHHRAGPTTNSPSFGVIRGGATIEAGPCGGGWCQAFIGGNAGFVRQQHLDSAARLPADITRLHRPRRFTLRRPITRRRRRHPYYGPRYHDWRTSRRW